MDKIGLVNKALEAREMSYSPYSNFKVGAALLAQGTKLYIGTNIENAAYSPTLCAERSAFAAAISDGMSKFTAISIAGWAKSGSGSAFPCGVCRQFMSEFCDPNFTIIIVNSDKTFTLHTLSELLPNSFGPQNL